MKMFKQSMIVFLKELKCIIRDKKTFIFGLLLPLILVPSMLFIIDFSVKNMQGQVADNVNIAMNNKQNSFYSFCSVQDKLTVIDVQDPQKALDSGEISAYITIDENIDKKIVKKESFDLDIKYNNSSINSMMARPIVTEYEADYRYLVTNYVFKSEEELNRLIAVKVELQQDSQALNINTGSLYFNMLVPMMLILYCCMGSVGTAAELSAGEKERGTLEPLLSTCADRTGIIIGKLLATTAMGVISGLFTVLGLWIYLIVSSSVNSVNVSPLGMITLLIMTVFVAMFFASVNLTIGVYSRSFKEAQTYLMPVSIICLIPTFFTYTLDVSQIRTLDLCIPIFNVICIIKEIFAGVINTGHISIVLGWLIVYISIAFLITSKLFKRESIVFRV